MKYSYKLKIHDLTWTIKFVKRENENLDKACGITYKEDCKIYIDESLPQCLLKRTLRHEIVHAFIWTYGLENVSLKKYEEEDLCNFIETFGQDICDMTNTVYDWSLNQR